MCNTKQSLVIKLPKDRLIELCVTRKIFLREFCERKLCENISTAVRDSARIIRDAIEGLRVIYGCYIGANRALTTHIYRTA